ncbi:MAG: hypothetical protein ACYCYB_10650 [Candidatus Dormibacteria bacterium]
MVAAHRDGSAAFRVEAAVNSFILVESERVSLRLSQAVEADWAHEIVDEFRAGDCAVEEDQGLLPMIGGSTGVSPPLGPVSQWWQNAC